MTKKLRKALICPYGFMGDALFACSAARKLKEEGQFDVVDLATGLKQVEELLAHHEWLDNIIRVEEPTITPLFGYKVPGYDAQFELTETNKTMAPPMQAQLECGVREPDTKFEISLDPDVVEEVKNNHPEPYIAVMNTSSWKEKAFQFTMMEYHKGVDVPYLGYGGRLRDILGILHQLQNEGIKLVEVGLKSGVKSLEATRHTLECQASGMTDCNRGMVWDAAVIQNAKYFIGAEGGLANVAAAVHTPTILTSDFVHQLYGWNGVLKKIVNPQLGPRFYWPEDGHIDLSPYWDDRRIATAIIDVFSGDKTSKDFKYAWTRPTV